MRYLLAVLMLCSPAFGADLSLTVPPTNPVYTLIEIESTGEGTLTVIDKDGKVHSAFKCGDKYLFTGAPNNYLITYLKFVDGNWKVVNEPFTIGGSGDDPPPPTPSDYRSKIKAVIPTTPPESIVFDKAIMYVGFRVGQEKLATWGANAVVEQTKVANTQAELTSSPDAWKAFVVAWSQTTKSLPQTQWPEAWKITSDLLSNELQQNEPTSSTGSDTSKQNLYTLASYTPPIPSTLLQSQDTKNGGDWRSQVNGTTKQNDYSISVPAPTQTLPQAIPQQPILTYSQNCGQQLFANNCGQQVTSVLCSPSGASVMCGSGQMLNSQGCQQVSMQRYTVRPLSCGTQYAESTSCGQTVNQAQTCTNMQGELMEQAGCSLGSTYQGTVQRRGLLRGGLILRRSGRAGRGLFFGRRAAMNSVMQSGCHM